MQIDVMQIKQIVKYDGKTEMSINDKLRVYRARQNI